MTQTSRASLEERLGYTRRAAPLRIGTAVFHNASISQRNDFEFDPQRPRILITGGGEPGRQSLSHPIETHDEQEAAFDAGYRISARGGQVITNFASPRTIPFHAALGAAAAAEEIKGVRPIAINRSHQIGIDPNRIEPYGLIYHMGTRSPSTELDSVLRNIVMVKSAHVPVAFGGWVDTHDVIATYLELHTKYGVAFYEDAGGITRDWPALHEYMRGNSIIKSAIGSELGDLAYERALEVRDVVNGRVPFFSDGILGNYAPEDLPIFDHSAAEKHGFVTMNTPLFIGDLALTAASISYRPGFEFDMKRMIAFSAGGAFDYYGAGDFGIDVEQSTEMAYLAGHRWAELGGYLTTGLTPTNSVPHHAAMGAANAGQLAIGGNSQGSLPDNPDLVKHYAVVLNTGINSGDMFVDFIIRNVIPNCTIADAFVAGTGMIGTFDEGTVGAMLEPNRQPGILPGATGATPLWANSYRTLFGREVLTSSDPKELMDMVMNGANEFRSQKNNSPGYFYQALQTAGIPIIGGPLSMQ